MFPSLVLAKSHTTYNQQKDQNRLWAEGYSIVKMFSMDTLNKLYIFGHDGNAFPMNSA